MAPSTFSAAGDKAAQTLSLQYAIGILRRASRAGAVGVTKKDVVASAFGLSGTGRAVISMRGGAPMPAEYYGRPALVCGASRDMCGGAPMPAEYYGRPALVCGASRDMCGGAPMPAEYYGRSPLACGASRDMCGGSGSAKGVVSLEALKAAIQEEGIRATPFAVKQAHAFAGEYVKGSLEALLRNDYPRAKTWSAAQVIAAAAKQ